MPQTVEDLLSSLRPRATERTTSAALLDHLTRSTREPVKTAVDRGDGLENLSLDQLIEEAKKIGQPAAGAAPAAPVVAADPTKVAAEQKDKVLGEVAAHAFWQELGLIKQANEQGVCRFCKAQPATAGTSICAECAK